MALTDQISAVMTRIAAEIKDIRTKIAPLNQAPVELTTVIADTSSSVRTQLDTLYIPTASSKRVLSLAVGAPVPVGTPDGTVIVRYTP